MNALNLRTRHEWRDSCDPLPFNPDYRPWARSVQRSVVADLQASGAYDTLPIEQRKALIAKRYSERMAECERWLVLVAGVSVEVQPIASEAPQEATEGE